MAEQGGSMQEGNSTKRWIDAYLDRKPAELAGIAEKLRKLVKTAGDLGKPSLRKLILAAARQNKKEPMQGMKPNRSR
jgi:hypothetical protein